MSTVKEGFNKPVCSKVISQVFEVLRNSVAVNLFSYAKGLTGNPRLFRRVYMHVFMFIFFGNNRPALVAKLIDSILIYDALFKKFKL